MLEYIRKSAESWGVKVLFGLIIIVFVFWGVGSYQGNQTQVVAYVNERPILFNDFSRAVTQRIRTVQDQNPGMSSEDIDAMQIRQQVLNEMINSELLREEAERLHITAAASEVAGQIRAMPYFYNEQGQFDTDLYRRILAQQQMSPGQFEHEIAQAIMQNKIRQFATLPAEVEAKEVKDLFDYSSEQRSIEYLLVPAADFTETVTPDDSQIQAYYEEHKETYKLPERIALVYMEFTPKALADKAQVPDAEIEAVYNSNKNAYMAEEQVKARHILLMTADDATPEQEDDIKAKLQDLARQAREGADFAELAKEHSDDLTKDQGGDLGWVSRGEMVQDFEDVLFSIEPGKVSEPVRTPYGWHIILVEERKESQLQPLEEVRDKIRDSLKEARAADILTDLLDQGLEQVISGISMQEIADSLELELKKSELLSAQEAKSKLGLEENSIQTLFAMQEGQPTDTPLATSSGYILAEVLEKKPAEYQSLEEVRDTVREAVVAEQAMEKAKTRAEELAASIKDSGLSTEQQTELKESQPFGRQGFIPGLGMNPMLTDAAFAAKKDTWLDKPYAMGNGYLLAKVTAIHPPSEELWNQNKDRFQQLLQQGRSEELFYAYISNLRQQAQIEITNPDYLR